MVGAFGMWTVLFLFFSPVSCGAKAVVHQWEVFEEVFPSGRDWADPPREVSLDVEFRGPGDVKVRRSAFWDGGRTWRVRFAPPLPGSWSWRTTCRQDPGLDGRSGSFSCVEYKGDNPLYLHGPIRISRDGWHFIHADGTPWFWLADTVWNGPLLAGKEDWRLFLEDRRRKGFSAVQFVALPWRGAGKDASGRSAFEGRRRITLNPAFFQRMDERIRAVAEAGLVPVPVMFWAVKGKGSNPGCFLPEDRLVLFGRYMVARWGAYPCIWLLAGDGYYEGKKAEKWKRVGRAVFGDRPESVVSMHPCGRSWVGEEFRREPWFDFIGYQSGHGDGDPSLAWLVEGPPARFWKREPHCPVVNLEPNYEGIVGYTKRSIIGPREVRRACYWSLLVAPPAGVTYGAHGVWSWQEKAGPVRNHPSSGPALPWREAMGLPGSEQMKHLARLFRSVEWWKLRPAKEPVRETAEEPAHDGPTHLVYVRRRDGWAGLFLDGRLRAQGYVRGNFSNWDGGMPFVLANERTGNRPWRGVLYRIAVYAEALSPEDVEEHFRKGRNGSLSGSLALYDFRESQGVTVKDTAGSGRPLDLRITDPSAVKPVPGGGLRIDKAVSIVSGGAASKIIEACRKSSEISLEAWVKPANMEQGGPARIATLSFDPRRRNFTLGQEGKAWIFRLRTTRTNDNGLPGLSSPGGGASIGKSITAAAAKDGTFAIVYLPVGCRIELNRKFVPAARNALWYDPRTGKTLPARLCPGTVRTLEAPDGRDWVLLLRR